MAEIARPAVAKIERAGFFRATDFARRRANQFVLSKVCQVLSRKISRFRFSEKYGCLSRIPFPSAEGRLAIVTDVGGGMQWTLAMFSAHRARAKASWRTAKSCGPDPPTLGSSLADDAMSALTGPTRRNPRGDGGNKARSPRRARISVKTIAQGMPDVLAEPVVPAACVFCCRRAMGAACTRHSLPPLSFEGQ